MVKVADRVHWFTMKAPRPPSGSGKWPACGTSQEKVFAASTREKFGEAILAGEACGICARAFLKLTVFKPSQPATSKGDGNG